MAHDSIPKIHSPVCNCGAIWFLISSACNNNGDLTLQYDLTDKTERLTAPNFKNLLSIFISILSKID